MDFVQTQYGLKKIVTQIMLVYIVKLSEQIHIRSILPDPKLVH